MSIFAFIFGLLNLCLFAGCFVWGGVNQSDGAGPVIVGALSFNMAMAWLILAGLRRDRAGQIGWTAKPLLLTLGVLIALGIVALRQTPSRQLHAGEAPFKTWKCLDGSVVMGSENPCPGGWWPW